MGARSGTVVDCEHRGAAERRTGDRGTTMAPATTTNRTTSRYRRRVPRLLAALVALCCLAVVQAAPSSASVPSSYCTGRSSVSLVKTYAYGSQDLALRCGTSSWGFVHIKSRWNSTFDSMIALTIARGEKVNDLQQDGGTKIFALFDNSCHELFRVIYNGNALYGTGVSPQGIITAYYRTGGAAAAPSGTSGASLVRPAYRTDCGVNQNI